MLVNKLSPFSWEKLRREWRDLDFVLLIFPVILTIIGSIAIYSTTVDIGLPNYWWQHLVLGGIGLLCVSFLARWFYERLLYSHWTTYAITNIFLLVVIVAGTSANGAQSWLSIGDFNLQPSEFAKLGLIISLAAIIHEHPIQHPFDMFQVMGVTVLPWTLIMLQPDLGTGLVFAAITLGMLYWGGAKLGWLLLLCSPLISAILFGVYIPAWLAWVALMGVTAWRTLPWMRSISLFSAIVINLVSAEIGSIIWSLLKEYQKQRLVLFLEPSADPLGGGYHLIQSQIAIGAGKFLGKGFLHGTQTQLNFIPEQHTDFIFSAVGEEFGFIGCSFVLVLYLGICWRLLVVAQVARDNFGSLLAIGLFSMILFQVLVNIGMTIGVSPVTGIPLPWLSYGRSALLTNFLAIGLVESVATHRRTIKF